MGGNAKCIAEQRLRCCRTKAHHNLRFHRLDFGDQPWSAGDDFDAARFLMNTALTHSFELEMLDGIGLVRERGVDLGVLKRLRQQSARRSDEGKSLLVLIIARLFADEHQRRIGFAVAEDGLRSVFEQGAAAAVNRRASQRAQPPISG